MTQPVVFDIETHSTDEVRDMPSDKFFRLGGLSGFGKGSPVSLYDTRGRFMDHLDAAPLIAGHNVWAFDLPALGYTPADLLKMARERKVLDTWTLATLLDQPPISYQPRKGARVFPTKPEQYRRFYRLDNLAFRYGVEGKTHELKDLAKPYADGACCGFGAIPTEDPDFRAYLAGDVRATRAVLATLVRALPDGTMSEYQWREQSKAAFMSVVQQNGFRLDVDLAQKRDAAGKAEAQRWVDYLAAKYDMPLTNSKGQPYLKPTTTNPGKAALMKALVDNGANLADLPKTKNGAVSLGGEGLRELANATSNPQLAELCNAVATIAGVRSVYQTALDSVWSDGFCHPSLDALQRSGRTSTTDPGLTVFGKRGGRHIERDVFLPDILMEEAGPLDGHVLGTVDLSQIDARGVAVQSQDQAYMDLFGPGRDLHREVARELFAREYAKDSEATRDSVKPLNHGYNYGLGLPRFLATHPDMDPELAKSFYAGMRERFPRLHAWQDEVREAGARDGFIDNGWGRLMKVDPERAFTQAPALKGQGWAADAMWHGLLSLDNSVKLMVKATIHDELVYSCPARIARDVRQHIVDCLTFEWAPAGGGRPIRVEADASKFGVRWGDLYAK